MLANRDEVFELLDSVAHYPSVRKFIITRSPRAWCEIEHDFRNNTNFVLSNGCTKGVIMCHDWDFVLKVGFRDGDFDQDFCAIECRNYQRLVDSQQEYLTEMFAPVERVGRWCGIPIYAQSFCSVDDEGTSEELKSHQYSNWVEEGCEGWERDPGLTDEEAEEDRFSYFEDYYYIGSDTFEDISDLFYDSHAPSVIDDCEDYLYDHLISDIHTGNIGVLNGIRVIVDYSGFDVPERYVNQYKFWHS